MGEPTQTKKPFRLTVGTKLGGLISVLLLASVAGLVSLATHLFADYSMAQIQETTFNRASDLSAQTRQFFEATTEKVRVLGTILMEDGPQKGAVRDFFLKDKSVLGVVIHRKGEAGEFQVRVQAYAEELKNYDPKDLLSKGLAVDDLLKQGESGTQVFVAQLSDGTQAVVLGLPFMKEGDRFTHTITALLRLDSISRAFTDQTSVTSYMVDRNGTLLAHSDMNRAMAHENVSTIAIVQEFLAGKTYVQKEYDDPLSGERFMGAFKTVGFAGLGVMAEVRKAKAFEGPARVRKQSMLAAAVILFISFMLGNYFSARTITGPILVLAEAAGKIARGDFNIGLKPRSKDEIGDLSLTFNEMAKGLVERDKVKEVFNKFHNEAITSKLLAGEVKLGGERLEATIFFSDVRGFTALSETLQPEEVVEMLNEYMTRMVSIIHAHKGVVDKYVGDAIMALWGVPLGGPEDTVNAVKACIEMRKALDELNQLRISRGQGVLKIGMGLNRGEVIAGNIGSEEKMEYTVIGDAVNTASRIESMTKEYGTDLLISKSVFDSTQGKYVFEPVKAAKVKGKTTALELYKVSGYYGENGLPVIVQTPYSSYAAEKSDKGVHDESKETTSTASLPGHLSEDTSTGVVIMREKAREQHDPDTGEIDVSGFVKKPAA